MFADTQRYDEDRPAPRPARVVFGPQQTVHGRGVLVATCGGHALTLMQQQRGDGDSWTVCHRNEHDTMVPVTGRWLNVVEVKAEARIAFTHITGETDGSERVRSVLQFDREAIFRDYDAWRRR